jgi:hypothetical protein
MGGRSPHLLEEGGDASPCEALRALAQLGLNGPGDIEAQFEFELDVLLDGLEPRRTSKH